MKFISFLEHCWELCKYNAKENNLKKKIEREKKEFENERKIQLEKDIECEKENQKENERENLMRIILLPFIGENCRLNYDRLSENPTALSYLISNPRKIGWLYFIDHANSDAFNFIINHKDMVMYGLMVQYAYRGCDRIIFENMFWKTVSRIANVSDILENNMDKIQWRILSSNIHLIPLLEQNQDKIDWSVLSGNINAISLLEKNQDKIDWCLLSENINAISLLEKNQDKINWYNLSGNINAISLLEQNLDKVHWYTLSANSNAISILEQNQDKIDWYTLSRNCSIFKFDYDYYKQRMDIHREELMKTVFHPRRLAYYLEKGFDIFDV